MSRAIGCPLSLRAGLERRAPFCEYKISPVPSPRIVPLTRPITPVISVSSAVSALSCGASTLARNQKINIPPASPLSVARTRMAGVTKPP